MRNASVLSAPFLAVLVAAVVAACSPKPTSPTTTNNTRDSGPAFGNDAGDNDSGTAASTVASTVTGGSSSGLVTIENAVVTAAESYTGTSGVTGTFYIQDQAPSSTTGISVYVAGTDTVTFPNIGDILTVSGNLSTYEGALQISTYNGMNLALTNTGSNGLSSAGAYSPAGSPAMETAGSDFAATNSGAHPELLGNTIQFAGSIAVTNDYPSAFVSTNSDGGTTAQGFEITNGIWVDDENVYYDCMRKLGPDGGTLFPDLSGGIRGVWDNYQDPGVTGGPIYPILIPMTCDDLNPEGIDAGMVVNPVDSGMVINPTDSGMVVNTGDAGPNSVAAAVSTGTGSVTIDDSVVIAVYSYAGTDGGTTGTFIIQDQAPNTTVGVEVYVALTDTAVTFPAIGDVVSVTGYISDYYGNVQVATSTTPAVQLTVTTSGTNGLSSGGAYTPAGNPIDIPLASEGAYAVTNIGAFPNQIGNVLQLAGPLTVTKDTAAGMYELKTVDAGPGKDGGKEMVSEGFTITGGIYVYDSDVYYNCMKGQGPDGGPLFPTLTNGIVGVWERYQDPDAGTLYPVLMPMTCADFDPVPFDAGTGPVDAGMTMTDAGTMMTDAGTHEDAGTHRDAGTHEDAGTPTDAGNTGAGTQGATCASDSDCSSGFTCLSDLSTGAGAYCAAACTANAQCTGTSKCNKVSGSGVCLETCTTDSNCTPGVCDYKWTGIGGVTPIKGCFPQCSTTAECTTWGAGTKCVVDGGYCD